MPYFLTTPHQLWFRCILSLTFDLLIFLKLTHPPTRLHPLTTNFLEMLLIKKTHVDTFEFFSQVAQNPKKWPTGQVFNLSANFLQLNQPTPLYFLFLIVWGQNNMSSIATLGYLKVFFFHLSIVKRVSTISCSNIALRSATLHSNINLVLSFSHKAATRYGVNIALEPYNVALETQYNINTYRSTSEWQYQNKNKIYLKMVGWHEKMTGFMMSSITKEADAPNYSYIMLYTVLYSASYSASQSATKRHLALSILSLRYDGPEFWCQISAPLPYWSARALQP